MSSGYAPNAAPLDRRRYLSGNENEVARSGKVLFLAILVITLWQNYYDIEGIMAGEDLALYIYNGPILAKLSKDFLNIVFLFILLFHYLKRKINPLSPQLFVLLFFVAVLAGLSAATNGVIVPLFGLRWAFPLVLFFIMGGWVATLDKKWASSILFVGMVICIITQFYQLLYMPPVFGELAPGIPARTPGIFIAPNTTALFACTSAACIMVFNRDNTALASAALALAIAICFACQSGTGIVCVLILLLRLFLRQLSIGFLFVSGILIALIFPYLNAITGRSDYVELSGGGRIDRLFEIAVDAATGIANFGVYTNAANLASKSPELMVAVDSLIASYLGNFGILSFPILLVVYKFARSKMIDVNWAVAFPCLIVFGLFSFTSIIFEAFPMNLLLGIGIWSAGSQYAKR